MKYNDITPKKTINMITLSKTVNTGKDYSSHIALIDGDIIAYKAAFANQDNTDWKIVERNVFSYVSGILKDININEYIGFLSSGISYRHKLVLPKPYKGNRSKEKPKWLANINMYLIDNFKFKYVDDLEADDCISLLVSKKDKDYIIYSCDKDFFQLESTIYNFVTKKLYEVNKEQSYYNLAYQILVGDTADNILGVPMVGPVKAEKLLSDWKIKNYKTELKELFVNKFDDIGVVYFNNTYQALRLLRKDKTSKIVSNFQPCNVNNFILC